MFEWLRFLRQEVQSLGDLSSMIAETAAQAVASRLPQRVIFWSVARAWASADRKAEDFAMLSLLPALPVGLIRLVQLIMIQLQQLIPARSSI